MKQTAKKDGGFLPPYKLIKKEDINLPARSSIFFTLINFICKGAAFLFTPIFTRLLSSAGYGEYSLFSTFLSLCTVAATMEISGGIIMRLFQREREKHFLSILSAWLISIITALPITLLLWAAKRFFDTGMSFPYAYLFLFISQVLLTDLPLSKDSP